ncbi:glycosyl transferase family 1 [Capsulimonas corticalis]|uniref:Glycosyl transferase family 1 n=1 Tax=Capsulimonas corticalis TaxID=2219043 RepID=A0A402CVC5_9BACT|nr:glycosyltransferase [Capsulimonas corticalis]BDI30362.1 glycosyl transferase family 1 [Capsulimonas corticalis]
MKILIVSPVAEAAHVRKIPAALAKHDGVEITVIAPNRVAVNKVYDPSGWISYEREENSDGFRFIPLPLIDPANFHKGYQPEPLRQAIKTVKPDVIQVWSGPVDPFLYQVTRARTRVFSRAKVVFYGFDNLHIPLSRFTIPKWRSLWTQIAGGFEADSEAIACVRAAGFVKPLERVFWGIPLEDFKPADKAALRQTLSLPAEPLVGYIGRLVTEKGLMHLLGALGLLPPNVHCLLIGGGPMQSELELWIDLLGLKERVHLLAPMSATLVASYMACLDALALPSLSTPVWKEQYGRVLGEAMACGVPVVGSDSGAIPEVIGEAGLVVPEANTQALADGLRKALFDEEFRSRVIPLGLKRAPDEMSVEAMSTHLLDFYRRILRRN